MILYSKIALLIPLPFLVQVILYSSWATTILPFSGAVILKTPTILKVLLEIALTTAGLVVSSNFMRATFETWLVLSIAQLNVPVALPAGLTCPNNVQFEPLSKEYDTLKRLTAAWLQVTNWVEPTGVFSPPL